MNSLKFETGVSYWAVLIVVGAMVAAMIVAVWPEVRTQNESLGPAHIRLYNKMKDTFIGVAEEARIEKWIVDNKLNQYGDPANTLYAGGTPLFDETTGEKMGRFEYIKRKHPSQPWNR